MHVMLLCLSRPNVPFFPLDSKQRETPVAEKVMKEERNDDQPRRRRSTHQDRCFGKWNRMGRCHQSLS